MHIKLYSTYLFFGLLLFLFSCNDKTNEQSKNVQPNILFILSDDHTSQAWGVYGGQLRDYVKNENIKRLAAEGALLNNVFCTNSICTPSRASILTGQYSHVNQVFTLNEPLPQGYPNIAKSLKDAGYHTALIGKWHLVKKPEGFDYFNVLPGQGRYWDPLLKSNNNWKDGYDTSQALEYKGFSTDVITDLTIQHLKERDSTKPFLMFCNFKATHEPFDYPERYKSLYEGIEIPEPETLFDFSPETTGRTFIGQKLEVLANRWVQATKDPENWWTTYPGLPFSIDGLNSIQARKKIYQKLVKDFMRSGAAIDDNIGKLLDFLEEEGIANNTIVIYTADQGYFLGEHGFFDKRLIYEESLRMPFVIRYPKEIKGGKEIDDIILNIDFAALLADYAGIEKPEFVQGESFRDNLIENNSPNWRSQMYYRYWLHSPERPSHFGLRNKRYKLIFFYGQDLGKKGTSKVTTTPNWEFYDLQNDPHELYNAIHDKKYADIIEEMKTEIINERIKYHDLDDNSEIMKGILSQHLN
ncbi:sulfatase [Yeosuana sp. MJ-SS3]|uniref:Sulfatase n=1 Tax=Gilvirhabdus luticola TaxID=3079858 RepID=A0ABU3UA04_9FLAO|nr:sulfatase [Yeosuana sp. MJ-SS3]MDU8887211.1 sulfatase [Yeosuana sp. MJ-SS3]